MRERFISRQMQSELLRLNGHFPIVVVTGPRQSGKTTLCRNTFSGYDYVNLENVAIREQVALSPLDFLRQYEEGLILDEVQQSPELFSYLQVLVDEMPEKRFILTGSSNLALMEKVTQSLAGRAAVLSLLPLSLKELGENTSANTNTLLLNGGYPAVWAKQIPVQDVARQYYNTYVERDVRQLLNVKNMTLFQTFIRLCAGRIGNEWNASALSNETGVTVHTIQEWLSVLEASYIVFKLPPFFRNIGKRLIKTPKIYFCDTGLACFLLGIESEQQLATHPLRGAIFENYIVLEFLKGRLNEGKLSNIYYYRDQSQREVDIIQEFASELHAYEIKSARIFQKDFLKNLRYLKELLGSSLTIAQVIYDGDIDVPSKSEGVINFRTAITQIPV